MRYLHREIGLPIAPELEDFLIELTEAQTATRYPEELVALQREFTEPVVSEMIANVKEVIAWAKKSQ